MPINEAGKRKVDTAVVFFGPPHGPLYEDDGIAPVHAAWLTPAVCVEKKKLRFGPDCGALVPATAKVRLSSGRELTLSRGGGVRDRENPNAIKPPYAPACCMYAGCQGRAMPFVPKEGPFQATRNLVAVWPADADVGLDIPFDYPELKDGPENVFQSFEVRGQQYATTGTRLSGGQLLHRENGAWVPLEIPGFKHCRAAAVLAVTDLDADGKNELLAYAAWANDYGFAVVVEGRKDSPYNYSCGNI